MKNEDIDWKVLRGSIITFILCISLSGGLIFGSLYFEKQMQLQFNRANAEFRSISSRYLAIDEEEKAIKNFLPRFISLYGNGVIGNEQRLNWIEELRNSGNEFHLSSLGYHIDSQSAYTPAFPVVLGSYRLYSSKMLLNMQLLHVGDFLKIFDSLDKNAKGIYSLTSCQLSSGVDKIENNPDAANVIVQCEMQWYTIRLADGKTIKV